MRGSLAGLSTPLYVASDKMGLLCCLVGRSPIQSLPIHSTRSVGCHEYASRQEERMGGRRDEYLVYRQMRTRGHWTTCILGNVLGGGGSSHLMFQRAIRRGAKLCDSDRQKPSLPAHRVQTHMRAFKVATHEYIRQTKREHGLAMLASPPVLNRPPGRQGR